MRKHPFLIILLVFYPLFFSCNFYAQCSKVWVDQRYCECPPSDPPFTVGAWRLKFRGGVAPVVFADRDTLWQVAPELTTTDAPCLCDPVIPQPLDFEPCPYPLFDRGRTPKFWRLFQQAGPYFGGEFGVAAWQDTELFVEVTWRSYKGRRPFEKSQKEKEREKRMRLREELCLTCTSSLAENNECVDLCGFVESNPIGPDLLIKSRLCFDLDNDYTVFGAYAGWRFYWDCGWNDRLLYYLGTKVGLIQRNEVRTTLVLEKRRFLIIDDMKREMGDPEVVKQEDTLLFQKKTDVGGGFSTGFDVCLNHHLSIFLMAEVLFSAPFSINQNIRLNDDFAPTQNIIFGNTGMEIAFPVTLGLCIDF